MWVSPRTQRIDAFVALFERTASRPLSDSDLNDISVVEREAAEGFARSDLPEPRCRGLRLATGAPTGSEGFLEISGLTANPFSSPATMGVFARVSLGHPIGGTWYWLQLSSEGEGRWSVVKVIELDVQDG